MKLKIFALSLLTAFAVSSCAKPKGRPLVELTSESPEGKSYTIRPGDILNVDVYGEAQLSGERAVREDGQLTMKFVGDIKVEGMTLVEVSQKIEKELSKFIPATTVSVNLSRSAPIRYYLAGKFMSPGEKRSDGKITFLQAIATGGQFQPFADESSITLIRHTSKEEFRYVLDYNNVVLGREPNPELRDGDIISIGQ